MVQPVQTYQRQDVDTIGAGDQRIVNLDGPPAAASGTLVVTTSTAASWHPQSVVLAGFPLSYYQRLTELSMLQANWDSYGASPISEKAVDRARRFSSQLVQEFPQAGDISPYTVAPLPNGGVQLEWRGPQRALEIEIDAAGRFSSLLVEDHETGRTYDERGRVSAAAAVDLVSQVLWA
jgi:hypothetical protein